ncbi:hypothetical protein ES703_09108 [subsurface metagenome]
MEGEATWNIYKTDNNWTAAGGDYVTSDPAGGSAVMPADFGWVAFNVKDIVQDAYDGSVAAELLIKFALETFGAADNHIANFYSSEGTPGDTTLRPKLYIEYSPAGEVLEGAATLLGVGTLAGIGRGIFIGKSAFSGVGTLASVGRRNFFGTATLAGVGTLATVGRKILTGLATLAGTGTLVSIGRRIFTGVATLTGVGTLVGIGRLIISGKATLSGVGTLIVSGSIVSVAKVIELTLSLYSRTLSVALYARSLIISLYMGNNRSHIYEYLKSNNYPLGYRVLCMNCNFAIGVYGYCPHCKVEVN